MALDPALTSAQAREALQKAPGNDYLDDHWKWSEAKVVTEKNSSQYVLVPAKYPSVTPDLAIVDAADKANLLSSEHSNLNADPAAGALFVPRKWKLILPSFESSKAGRSEEIETIKKLPRTSNYKLPQGESEREMDFRVNWEGKLVHELEHKDGKTDFLAYKRQFNFVRYFDGNQPSDDASILVMLATGYSSYTLGEALAEATRGDLKHELFKDLRPGGSLIKLVASKSISALDAQLKDQSQSEENRKALQNERTHWIGLRDADSQTVTEFIKGYSHQISQQYLRDKTAGFGFSPKQINDAVGLGDFSGLGMFDKLKMNTVVFGAFYVLMQTRRSLTAEFKAGA